jgi:hypothetical protein
MTSKLDILNFNNECLTSLYVELFGIINLSDTNKSNLTVVNNFLSNIVNIFDQKDKFDVNNWKSLGKKLLIFAKIYIKLITSPTCFEDYKKLIGIGKEWTMFLCLKRPPFNYRPFRMLYKLLGFIGILYTDCIYFYLYDSTKKNTPVQLLNTDEILQNMYNSKLRMSKSNVENCLKSRQNVDSSKLMIAKEYINMAIYIRNEFLTNKYCGDIFKNYKIDAQTELKHDYFIEQLKIINTELTSGLKF